MCANNIFSLRSFISALFWLTIGIAAAICIALTPVSQDPYLVWMYAGLAIVGFVAGCTFFLCFHKGRKWSANAVILEAVPVESASNDARYGEDKAAMSKGV
jgi:POT family proton-dependent oligopeptide transporter